MELSSIITAILLVLVLFWIGIKCHLFENKGDRRERIVGS